MGSPTPSWQLGVPVLTTFSSGQTFRVSPGQSPDISRSRAREPRRRGSAVRGITQCYACATRQYKAFTNNMRSVLQALVPLLAHDVFFCYNVAIAIIVSMHV